MKIYRIFYPSGHRFELEGTFHLEREPESGITPMIILGEGLNNTDEPVMCVDPRSWIMSTDMQVIWSPFTSDREWVQEELAAAPMEWRVSPKHWPGPTLRWNKEENAWDSVSEQGA